MGDFFVYSSPLSRAGGFFHILLSSWKVDMGEYSRGAIYFIRPGTDKLCEYGQYLENFYSRYFRICYL